MPFFPARGTPTSPGPPAAGPTSDRKPVRFGIRFLLALSVSLLTAITAGLTVYAYLSLDRLQKRMEQLAEGNLEEITLARRLIDSTDALLRPVNSIAERPMEAPTSASLNSIRMQLREVRTNADGLAARLEETGSGTDRRQMAEAEKDLDRTGKALSEFAAAAIRRANAERRRKELMSRLESQFDQHFEYATQMENQMRTQVSRAVVADLPAAAEKNELQPRLGSFMEKEMAWLGLAQDLRTANREVLTFVRALARETDATRLTEAQRDLDAQAERLQAWRRLPDGDTVHNLAKMTSTLLATLNNPPSLLQLRAEELAAEADMAVAARNASQITTRFSNQIRDVAHGLGQDVREGIRQTRTEVQRARAMLTTAALLAAIISILLVYVVINRRVIHPLERVTGAMRRAAASLSVGTPDWQAALTPPSTSGNDEVAAMYRALEVFRDMLVRREEDLGRSEAQLRTILRTINEAIQLRDGSGRLVFCNAAATQLLGGEPGQEAPVGREGWRYLHEDGTPFDPGELPHAVALRHGTVQTGVMMQVVNPTGASHWLLVNAQPVFGASPEEILGVVTSCSDVSEFKLHQSELEYLAHHDPLTNLPNRTLLEDRLEHALVNSDRHGTLVAVCYLDLDGFKPVNDQYGHAAGDILLREIAQRLKSNLRGGDTVARLGGDEFVLLLCELDDVAECEHTVQRVLQNIGLPCTVCTDTQACAKVTASIGVTIYPLDKADSSGLIRHADHAMYLAKQRGKNAVQIFQPEAAASSISATRH